MRFVQILDYFWNILNVNLPEINSLVTNAQYLQYNVILSLTGKKKQVCYLFQKGVHWENILFFYLDIIQILIRIGQPNLSRIPIIKRKRTR